MIVFPVLCMTKSQNQKALFRKTHNFNIYQRSVNNTVMSYCVSSSRSSGLPVACASCRGVTPSSFGRLMAISPPGWQSKSSASRYRPHLTARWRGDSLGLWSGHKITHTTLFELDLWQKTDKNRCCKRDGSKIINTKNAYGWTGKRKKIKLKKSGLFIV